MRNFWLRVQVSYQAVRARRKLGRWGALAQFGVDRKARRRLAWMELVWMVRTILLGVVVSTVYWGMTSVAIEFLFDKLDEIARVGTVPYRVVIIVVLVAAIIGYGLVVGYVVYARRMTGAASVLIELRPAVAALDELRRLQSWSERDPLHWASRNCKLRATRSRLRSAAWIISRQMAVLLGLEYRERSDARASALGRWLCWASEDLLDARRTYDALQACAEAALHLQGPLRFVPPKLCSPPGDAKLIKPRGHQRIDTLITLIWTRAVLFIPIFGILLTALIASPAKS